MRAETPSDISTIMFGGREGAPGTRSIRSR